MTPEQIAMIIRRLDQQEESIRGLQADDARLMPDRDALLERLTNAIGERSPDGKGGTGLVGEIARVQRDLAELIALKNQGIGLIIAISIFGVLIVLGIRQWIVGVIAPHP